MTKVVRFPQHVTPESVIREMDATELEELFRQMDDEGEGDSWIRLYAQKQYYQQTGRIYCSPNIRRAEA